MLCLVVSAAVAACSLPGNVIESPVQNLIPALKPGVYTSKMVEVQPVVTKEIQPDYPPELRAIVAGRADLVFTVRADGSVIDPVVVRADDVLFGEAAVTAVLKWKFRPAEVKGAPVDCRITLPFFFSSPYGYDNPYHSDPASSSDGPPAASHQTAIGQK